MEIPSWSTGGQHQRPGVLVDLLTGEVHSLFRFEGALSPIAGNGGGAQPPSVESPVGEHLENCIASTSIEILQ